MQVTSKGQVTIPQEMRNRIGLLPYTEVEFELADDHIRIRRASSDSSTRTRGRRVLEALTGVGRTRMTTEELMALTRGEE